MVGKEEFKRIKLVWDEKYYEAFTKAVGRCCLRKKEYSGYHMPAKGIQQLRDNPKKLFVNIECKSEISYIFAY